MEFKDAVKREYLVTWVGGGRISVAIVQMFDPAKRRSQLSASLQAVYAKFPFRVIPVNLDILLLLLGVFLVSVGLP